MSISQVSRDSTFDMRLSLTSFELSTHLVLSFKFCEFPNHSTFIVLISHESCSATFVSIEAQSRVLSLVGPSGLEPPTSCLSGTRSNLLSYEPMWLVSDFRHLNFFASPFRKASLLTFLLEESKWWRWRDSNPWPPACRAGALPAELHPHGLDLLSFRFSEEGFCLPRCQHWAIFPCGRPQSIFTTAELNFRVRNGNGWTLCVYNTDYFYLSQRTFPCSLKIEQQI